jgi:hypothetical protein
MKILGNFSFPEKKKKEKEKRKREINAYLFT